MFTVLLLASIGAVALSAVGIVRFHRDAAPIRQAMEESVRAYRAKMERAN